MTTSNCSGRQPSRPLSTFGSSLGSGRTLRTGVSSIIGWFLLALAAQYLATSTGVWIIGLALQTALTIFLLLKQQISGLN